MPGASVHDVAPYLRAHDVEAETREHAGDRRPIGRVLLDDVADVAADLLVIGAYSHSQFRETFFGGATHYVLRHANCPVLLSH